MPGTETLSSTLPDPRFYEPLRLLDYCKQQAEYLSLTAREQSFALQHVLKREVVKSQLSLRNVPKIRAFTSSLQLVRTTTLATHVLYCPFQRPRITGAGGSPLSPA